MRLSPSLLSHMPILSLSTLRSTHRTRGLEALGCGYIASRDLDPVTLRDQIRGCRNLEALGIKGDSAQLSGDERNLWREAGSVILCIDPDFAFLSSSYRP